ncbi:MAG: hypothetical protein ISN64_02250 [Rickettsia sp.]|nr:hypothetical protein [Rickettsia sp.]
MPSMPDIIETNKLLEEQYHSLRDPQNPEARDHHGMIPYQRDEQRTARQKALDALSNILTDAEKNVCKLYV